MKNKKLLIIAIIIIIILGVIFGIYKIRTSYLYNEDGTLSDGHAQLMETLRKVEDKEERKKQVDYALEQNLITQKDADELY